MRTGNPAAHVPFNDSSSLQCAPLVILHGHDFADRTGSQQHIEPHNPPSTTAFHGTIRGVRLLHRRHVRWFPRRGEIQTPHIRHGDLQTIRASTASNAMNALIGALHDRQTLTFRFFFSTRSCDGHFTSHTRPAFSISRMIAAEVSIWRGSTPCRALEGSA